MSLDLLLDYCIHVAFFLLLKLEGQRVDGHAVIDRLVESRLFLEKIKPMESKLKYQIDKLIRAAVAGVPSNRPAAVDPLHFKPRPEALVEKEDGNDGLTLSVKICSS